MGKSEPGREERPGFFCGMGLDGGPVVAYFFIDITGLILDIDLGGADRGVAVLKLDLAERDAGIDGADVAGVFPGVKFIDIGEVEFFAEGGPALAEGVLAEVFGARDAVMAEEVVVSGHQVEVHLSQLGEEGKGDGDDARQFGFGAGGGDVDGSAGEVEVFDLEEAELVAGADGAIEEEFGGEEELRVAVVEGEGDAADLVGADGMGCALVECLGVGHFDDGVFHQLAFFTDIGEDIIEDLVIFFDGDAGEVAFADDEVEEFGEQGVVEGGDIAEVEAARLEPGVEHA